MPDRPIIFDANNPEWTKEDFARARPVSDHPLLSGAFPRTRGAQKAPTKQAVSIRLDADLIESLRASGKGWQGRVNDILRREMLG